MAGRTLCKVFWSNRLPCRSVINITSLNVIALYYKTLLLRKYQSLFRDIVYSGNRPKPYKRICGLYTKALVLKSW